jgi:hypothetical protein
VLPLFTQTGRGGNSTAITARKMSEPVAMFQDVLWGMRSSSDSIYMWRLSSRYWSAAVECRTWRALGDSVVLLTMTRVYCGYAVRLDEIVRRLRL